MKSALIAFLVSLGLLVFVTGASAEDSTTSSTTRRETAKEKLEQRKDTIQAKKDEGKEAIGARIDNIKDRIASKEAALKARLSKFKDKKKAEIVERVSTNLNRINENRVNHSNKFLENATRLLEKLQDRVNQAGNNGKDTTSANSAITDAKTKIASASAAVATQSALDYTVTISSESGAKADSNAMRDKLHTDWKGVRKLLIETEQAVAEAVRVAATTLGGNK